MFDTTQNNLELLGGYEGRPMVGKVYNNADPLNQDRVQVGVPGLYDPTTGEVPWAGPVKISPFGIGSGWGVYGAPAVGSDVLVFLQGGDSHYPMYLSAGRGSHPEFMSGKTWGFVDPLGNKLRVNLETGDIQFVARARVTIDISPAGGLAVTAASPVNFTAPGFQFNGNLTVVGDVSTTGTLHNNGKDVGDTSRHSGVKSGPDTSGPVV